MKSIQKMEELLKAIQADPVGKEALENIRKQTSVTDVISLLKKLAEERGYDLTESDIREAIAEKEKTLKERTEKASADIQALTDEETEAVAGGYCTEMLEISELFGPMCESFYQLPCADYFS